MSRSRSKYRPGPKVRSVAHLARILTRESRFYVYDRVMTGAWVMNMSFQMLRIQIASGRLRIAVPIQRELPDTLPF